MRCFMESFMKTGTFFIGKREIHFRVTSSRSTISVRIDRYGKLQVSGPRTTTLRDINALLNKYNDIINQKLDNLKYNPCLQNYESGKKYLILGKLFKISMNVVSERETMSENVNYEIDDSNANINFKITQTLFNHWNKELLSVDSDSDFSRGNSDFSGENKDKTVVSLMFERLLCYLLYQIITDSVRYFCGLLGLQKPVIKLKSYKSRHGCCYFKKNLVIFDKGLIFHDQATINACVVHELVHFYEPNHSKKFYDMVYRYYPNYDLADKKLKDSVNYLSNLNRQLRQKDGLPK